MGKDGSAAAAAMTTPTQIERLGEHLRKLRLHKSGECLEAMLQHAAAQEIPYAQFLEQVLGEEVAEGDEERRKIFFLSYLFVVLGTQKFILGDKTQT